MLKHIKEEGNDEGEEEDWQVRHKCLVNEKRRSIKVYIVTFFTISNDDNWNVVYKRFQDNHNLLSYVLENN